MLITNAKQKSSTYISVLFFSIRNIEVTYIGKSLGMIYIQS